MFCIPHRWIVIKQIEQPSAFDELRKAGVVRVTNLHEDGFIHYHMITYKCEKCGNEKVERV
jgi:hypothetical protein